MIIGDKRKQVIENIRKATENGTFNIKVEVDDPVLTTEQLGNQLNNFYKRKSSVQFRINNLIARQIVNAATSIMNQKTKIIGAENINRIAKGAILTSNHFNEVENTVVRTFVRNAEKKKLFIVIQDTNLAMPGWVGFLMNYADTLPISTNRSYMVNKFEPMLKELLDTNNYVLIYPEQEMWFNYRKPRPLKRGAYYYAAKFNVPVISCFVEIQDMEKLDTPNFYKIQYILHVLQPIFPDPMKTVNENSIAMCKQDYQQKKEAYEAAYEKPLDYRFEPSDIAGWISPDTVKKCLSCEKDD